VFQLFEDAIAMAHFEVIQGRQGVLLQLMFVMLSECFAIGDDPRFHAGCHEEHLIVFRAFWLVPFVPLPEMLPRLFQVFDRVLAVHQQGNVIRFSLHVRVFEVLE
jgi:hypothetical protein